MLRRLALTLAALLAQVAPAQSPAPDAALVEDAVLTWRGTTPGFGSFSGLWLDATGEGFVTVSDKGSYVTGRLLRRDGRLVGVEQTANGPLLDPRGQPVGRYYDDAEALTMGPDGRLFVSFEGRHRVWAYDTIDRPSQALPIPAAFRALQNNSGLEALFTGPDGAIYAIPERSGELDRPYPVYRLEPGGDWAQAFSIPHRPPHLVTGADVGPDGRLYLLERHWNGLLSFSTRIRSFALTPQGVHAERILLESAQGSYDNLEGIATWRDAQGRIRLTAISDDNNNFFQRTEWVEFILTEPTVSRPEPRPEPRPNDGTLLQ